MDPAAVHKTSDTPPPPAHMSPSAPQPDRRPTTPTAKDPLHQAHAPPAPPPAEHDPLPPPAAPGARDQVQPPTPTETTPTTPKQLEKEGNTIAGLDELTDMTESGYSNISSEHSGGDGEDSD